MRRPFAVAQRPIYDAAPPLRSEEYKRWVRTWPCLVCKAHFVEAAHTGPHGLGQKAPDSTCIPLCKEHHAELHRGVVDFEEAHLIDIAQVVGMFNALWTERKAA